MDKEIVKELIQQELNEQQLKKELSKLLDPQQNIQLLNDYQELKQELGLGHYEGRGWRGFHHHATLSIAAAFGFLVNDSDPDGDTVVATLIVDAAEPVEHQSGETAAHRVADEQSAGQLRPAAEDKLKY